MPAINWLSNINPVLPWALLTLAIWLVQWAQRRWLPTLWEWAANLPFPAFVAPELLPILMLVRKVWQGLPSVLAGTLLGALMQHSDPRAAWLGAIAGACAPVWHELLKAFPWIPYVGRTGPAAKVTVVTLVFVVAGCAPAHTAADESAEDRCLAEVKAQAILDIANTCQTEKFAACPQHDALIDAWEKAADRCQRP